MCSKFSCKLCMTLIFSIVFTLAMATSAHSVTLWYNGDWNERCAISNEFNTLVSQSAVYDDFIVPAPGWIVDTVWSNNLMDFTGISQAKWEIRTAVSAGDGGTIFASGTSPATQVATGRSGSGLLEYTIEVTDLDILLPEGTCWLTVTPIGSGSGNSFISATNGLNAIGALPGNAFIDSIEYDFNFVPTTEGIPPQVAEYCADFSMGVGGTVVPIPQCSEKIAVLRQRPNGKQRLVIYLPPTTVRGEIGSPIASDLTFGDRKIALASVDINGDGIDEIAVIREELTGEQRLLIFNAPTNIKGEVGSLIASDLNFGNANTNNRKIDLAGVDINGDGIDEIAVINQRLNGRQRLLIFNAPTIVDGETGSAIASDMTFGIVTTNSRKTALAGVDINGDGIDEIAIINQRLNGRQRLLIFNAPVGVKGQTGDPIASDMTFGYAGSKFNNIAITGLHSQ